MASPIPVTGVMVREGEMTGDGRTFAPKSIRWGSDVLPIPIIFDREDGDHSGATVGYIDTVWREGADVHGSGFLSASDDAHTQDLVRRAAELMDEGAVGVSVGVDSPRGHADIDLSVWDEMTEEDGHLRIPMNYDDVTMTFTDARLRHLAIVDTPAFSTASLSRVTGALVASGGISLAHYFDNPNFGVAGQDDRLRYDPGNGKWSCPVTVQGDHVFGHVAPWGVCLRGQPGRCVTPPDGDLGGFMRGYAPAAGGQRTGVIQVAGSHADVGVGVMAAQKHYDKTGVGVADVRVGRDAYGIWFSGMIRSSASKEQRATLAASDVSGHWEMDQNGRPTLVGLPAVNVGGFPKGYLTAAEVASGIAASGRMELAHATFGALPTGLWEEVEVTPLKSELHGVDCGCAETAQIDLATILTFLT